MPACHIVKGYLWFNTNFTMDQPGQVTIKLNKSRLTVLLIGSIIFFIAGVWMLTGKPAAGNVSPFFLKLTGIFAVIFFGAGFFFLWKKITDEKPGLIINNEGITDNSSGVSAGFIPWGDITGIKLVKVFNQRFLMLIVRNPDEYILKQANALKRKAMQMNLKNYGSPVGISSNTLQCRLEELKDMLDDKLISLKAKN